MSVSDDPLSAVLEQLRSQGTLDSSGGFTLDLDKSLDKLSQFQVDNPRRYVHFLLAAACAKGASYIQFEISSFDVVACFDGEPFSHDELVNLFQILFDSQSDPSLRGAHHLAFAFNVTRQIGAKFVVFDSFQGGSGSRVQITSGLLQVARLQEPPWSNATSDSRAITNRFHMREPFDPDMLGRLAEVWLRRTTGSRMYWPEHEYLLSGRCGFAPLELWVNRELVRPGLDAILECWEGQGPVLKPGGLPLSIPTRSELYSGGVGLSRESSGSIHWIVDGIAYREPLEGKIPREVAFWIYCNELRTDVSHASLVQGPDIAALRQGVIELAPQVLPKLQATLRENPRAMQKFKGFAGMDIPRSI